ncbi:hypothetical protein QNN95_16175 (plasmid) [Exiguobacterium acetylicum]|uniref:hypothetical protein n=1 Tax=Exiguobacterium acetylicum TaxID=41170 RepID=UPI0035A5ABFC
MEKQHKTRQQKQTSRPITLTEIKNLVNGGTGVHTSQTAEDGMKTLLTYGFARLTSKNINAITKMVKSLLEVGTEYNLRVFQTQFGGDEDYEFSLPHFVDDRDH